MSEEFLGLEELSIRNLGVIESAQIALSPGLNVLTGETGAGKTMVLTALGLILGGKSDADRVRTGEDRLMVAGLFAVPSGIVEMVEEEGGTIDEGSLLITRTLTRDGKSRITLGGVPSTNSRVFDITNNLVEIHAQSGNQRLSKPQFVRAALDRYGKLDEQLAAYVQQYELFRELHKRITELQRDEANREEEVAKLKEFEKVFLALDPKPEDLHDIESELSRLENVNELQEAAATALTLLDNDEASVSSLLASAQRALHVASGKDGELEEIANKFSDEIFALNDSLSALQRYLARLDADPAKLDYLQSRKAAINSFIKKYGEGTEKESAFLQLIERGRNTAERLADLQGGSGRIEELKTQLAKEFATLKELGSSLSSARQNSAEELSKRITTELAALSMPHARVAFIVNTANPDDPKSFASHGLDEISIGFASHTGSELLPLGKTASGGELSRVMLAIEVVLAASALVPTYIFDEVDAGVGGKAAMEVGRRLWKLARQAQVIVVTHLPQVAVWADNHLVVRKSESGSVSNTDVSHLGPSERIVEIARMLSGQEESATAQEHAQELLDLVAAARGG